MPITRGRPRGARSNSSVHTLKYERTCHCNLVQSCTSPLPRASHFDQTRHPVMVKCTSADDVDPLGDESAIIATPVRREDADVDRSQECNRRAVYFDEG
jgi:hypothetical protein